MIPFTSEVFFSVFEQYNRAIWPAQIFAYVIGLVAVLLAFRPVRGSDRLIAAALAAAWVWTGVVYHGVYFATINIAAPAFAGIFVVQGLLFAWAGAIRGRLVFRFRADLYGCVALGFVLFAMAIYPFLGWLAGHGWPRAAMFGVAPCPTTIFTIGMLVLSAPRVPLYLVVIPVLWSLIGGTAVWLLDVPEDLPLPLTGLAGLYLLLQARPPKSRTPTFS